jgi:glycosyltransferase involved in cell wall biosynthesis
VVASDIPALRETAGDGALLVAIDRPAWTEALEQVSRDDALRASVRSRGKSRVALFSWQETARAFCHVFAGTRGG